LRGKAVLQNQSVEEAQEKLMGRESNQEEAHGAGGHFDSGGLPQPWLFALLTFPSIIFNGSVAERVTAALHDEV
jgi:hypothetical protein